MKDTILDLPSDKFTAERKDESALQMSTKEETPALEETAEGKFESTDKPDRTTASDLTAGDDMDKKIEAAVRAAISPLTQKLEAYEQKERIAARQTFVSNKAKELQIPDWRISEGFAFADTDDEPAIAQKLTAIKQNLITAGLDKKEDGLTSFISDNREQAKEQAKYWAQTLPDA